MPFPNNAVDLQICLQLGYRVRRGTMWGPGFWGWVDDQGFSVGMQGYLNRESAEQISPSHWTTNAEKALTLIQFSYYRIEHVHEPGQKDQYKITVLGFPALSGYNLPLLICKTFLMIKGITV